MLDALPELLDFDILKTLILLALAGIFAIAGGFVCLSLARFAARTVQGDAENNDW